MDSFTLAGTMMRSREVLMEMRASGAEVWAVAQNDVVSIDAAMIFKTAHVIILPDLSCPVRFMKPLIQRNGSHERPNMKSQTGAEPRKRLERVRMSTEHKKSEEHVNQGWTTTHDQFYNSRHPNNQTDSLAKVTGPLFFPKRFSIIPP